MTHIVLIMGDQLSEEIAALEGADPGKTIVLMAEIIEEARIVAHHKQKLVLIFAAMRHFLETLLKRGFTVDYIRLGDEGNTGTFAGEALRAVQRHGASRLIVTEPSEWRVREAMRALSPKLGIPVEIREDTRFFATPAEFAQWAASRTQLRMEYFYRALRRRTGILMDGDRPEGGDFNHDVHNRKPLPAQLCPPGRLRFAPDAITEAVIAMVEERFPHHFGELSHFGWATTRADALRALDHFITDALPLFGDYQDGMRAGEPFLFHGLLSPYLNLGLLLPREICAAVERAYRTGKVPLNAAEGFIRQILGWREYVRGLYWLKMPEYAETNALGAETTLPKFYWSGETAMACMADTIATTRRHAYAHHIQRLMVAGNFALLAGIRPAEIEEWFLIVYIDAFDWVELPNVHGMAIFADGGLLASKPYAASGAYIKRMSNYCGRCSFEVAARHGEKACPFTVLYWDFLARNRDRLERNPRMALPYRALDGLPDTERKKNRAAAARLRADLDGATSAPLAGRAPDLFG